MNKEYNHSSRSIIEACGFTEEELDKCLDGVIKLRNNCDRTSNVIEELERLIAKGEYPTFTRFIIIRS